jgi:hypothetical protein
MPGQRPILLLSTSFLLMAIVNASAQATDPWVDVTVSYSPRPLSVARTVPSADPRITLVSGGAATHVLSRSPHAIRSGPIAHTRTTATTNRLGTTNDVTISCMGGGTSVNPDQNIFVMLYLYVDGELVQTSSAWGYSPTATLQRNIAILPWDQPVECDIAAPGVSAQARDTIAGECPSQGAVARE